jgi:hypothetical protein
MYVSEEPAASIFEVKLFNHIDRGSRTDQTTIQLSSGTLIILFLITETIYNVNTEVVHFPTCLLACFYMNG